jgi:hypothetical protein
MKLGFSDTIFLSPTNTTYVLSVLSNMSDKAIINYIFFWLVESFISLGSRKVLSPILVHQVTNGPRLKPTTFSVCNAPFYLKERVSVPNKTPSAFRRIRFSLPPLLSFSLRFLYFLRLVSQIFHSFSVFTLYI